MVQSDERIHETRQAKHAGGGGMTADSRFVNIPEELRQLPQWVELANRGAQGQTDESAEAA